MPRYRITQEIDGKWVITNGSDGDLVWSGRHWIDPEQWGASTFSFDDQAEAESYAQEIWGIKDT